MRPELQLLNQSPERSGGRDDQLPPPAAPTPTPSPRAAWLYGVVFFAGAALMAFELVGSRLLAPFFGNSLFVWGSLIGVFLGALSIGYAVGGRISDRFPSAGALALILAAASLLTAAVVPLAEPVQVAVVGWNPGVRLNPLLSAIVLFGPASILMGMVSPYAVRLRAGDLRLVGSTAGTLYGLSTLGSIAGTLAAAFWLIQSFGSDTVVLLVAGTLGSCAAVCAMQRPSRQRTSLAAAALLLASAGVAVGASGQGSDGIQRHGDWSPVFRAAGYEPQFEPLGTGRQRAQVESSYHRIRVVDYDSGVGGEGPTRVLHFDNSLQAGVALQAGRADLSKPPLFDYVRAFDLVPALRPDAKKALFIGLGSGAAPMRLHQLRPDIEIDVVEIDPQVVRMARTWFDYDDRAIDTHVGDGRSWLAAQEGEEWDVVVIDAYFADSIPFHLTTEEFLRVVEDHLTADGLVAANLIGAVEGRRSRLLRSMLRTYRTAFRNSALFPMPSPGGEVPLEDFNNVELFASDAPLPRDAAELRQLVDAAQERVPSGVAPIDDEVVRRILAARYTGQVRRSGVPTLTDDYAPVDSLMSIEPDEG